MSQPRLFLRRILAEAGRAQLQLWVYDASAPPTSGGLNVSSKTSSGSIKYLTNPWSTAKEKFSLIIRKDTADHPDSELDSGISVNENYDQIEPRNRKIAALQGDYERIEEIRTLQSKTLFRNVYQIINGLQFIYYEVYTY